ncbi:MAG: exosortase system-associated protein, TIGR04073 family, partial [Methylococcales bacterium]
MKKFILPFLLLSLLVSSAPSLAGEQQSYGDKVGKKALNSFSNLTTAVLEIPKNIINTTNESNIAYGITGGLFKGVIHTIGRVL